MTPRLVKNKISSRWYDEKDLLHCEDGPAMIYHHTGREEWYQHGKLHRLDGPAIYIPRKYEAWYINGYKHRDDGPAIIQANGRQEWWYHGILHRENGPAIIYEDGVKVWYLHGCRVSIKRYLKMKNPAKSRYPELAMSIIAARVHDA